MSSLHWTRWASHKSCLASEGSEADCAVQANIHAFLESDDRISQVLGHIDEALLELDDIDMQITSYKMQLNVSST